MTEVKKHSTKPQIKIGDKFKTNCYGEIEVIYYNNANDIGVRFESGYERSASSGNIQKGKVKDPTVPTKTHARRDDSYAIILGKSYTNKDGYIFTPTEYVNASKIKVVFESGYSCFASAQQINSGGIRDYLSPSFMGVGIIGIGPEDEGNVALTKEYQHWNSMMTRAYSEGYKASSPTYHGVTVCKEWHNFRVFAEWCKTQKSFDDPDFVLDKDIFIKGNKEYSPDNCMFVHHQINGLFTKANVRRGDYPIGVYLYHKNGAGHKIAACVRVDGKNIHLGYFTDEVSAFKAYKEAKEKHIKAMAERFKDRISDKCYKALYAYQVEITD